METKTLDAIKGELQEHRGRTATKAETLRTELSGVDAQLARIDAALTALSGTGSSTKSSKPVKKSVGETKVLAPAANKAQVIELIAAELKQHEVIAEEELRACVEQKLVNTGHTRMGFSLRFREALADARFTHGEKGVAIK